MFPLVITHLILFNLTFFIESGQTYRLTTDNEISIENIGGENPQFKRSSSNNLSFPYQFADVVSINGSYCRETVVNFSPTTITISTIGKSKPFVQVR